MSDARGFGAPDGPLLVFGGPYGNLEATEALLAEAERRAIPAGRVICTGDLDAYCADPGATVARLRAAGVACVMGNVEEQLASGGADCACGYAPGSACDRLAASWYAHCERELDGETRRWMGALPRKLELTLAGRRLAVVHGAPSRINRFVFASADADDLRAEIALGRADGVIGGHCGLPFARLVDGRLWLNAGAIGMPANDGTPRVWFAILGAGPEGIEVSLHALQYDHARAAAKMRARGLPEGYAAALESGLWPSCDVLPAAELAQRGRPLAETALRWPTALPAAAE